MAFMTSACVVDETNDADDTVKTRVSSAHEHKRGQWGSLSHPLHGLEGRWSSDCGERRRGVSAQHQ